MKKKIVILTGAGMSAESGIATFRDSNGLWENYKVEDVASIDGFNRNPQLVLEFYNMRRKELLKSEPNRGHLLLTTLEKKYDVHIITQNVDNLHEQAGSKNVVHLHGELMKYRSVDDPNTIYEFSEDYQEIKWGDLDKKGRQLRPHIVWFGEAVPMIDKAIKLTESADIFVIIGTSLNVYPAASLLNFVKPNIPIFLIDPKDVKTNTSEIHFIQDIASRGIEKLMVELENL